MNEAPSPAGCCFPAALEPQVVNDGTGVRGGTRGPDGAHYNRPPKVPPGTSFLTHRMSTLEDLAERVERLLLRHEELKRTNTLLEQQLAAVAAERDSLRSRLGAARSRIDALIERLPEPTLTDVVTGPGPGPDA